MFKSALAVLASVLIFTLIVAVSSQEKCESYNSCVDCIGNGCIFLECNNSSIGPHCAKNNTCEGLNATSIIKNIENCTTSTTVIPTTPSAETTTVEPKLPPSDTSTSESTSQPTKPTSTPSGRHFDAPSFIGGTVLSLGLLAIIYVGFKFYKARTERNYHTL